MTDRIRIEDLAVRAIIGVHDHERRVRQTLYVDVEFPTDAEQASSADNLADADDYQAIAGAVTAVIETGKFRLIETAAERTAAHLIRQFDLAEVALTVHKPSALGAAARVSVTLARSRDDSSPTTD